MSSKAEAAALSVCRVSLAFIWIYQGVVPKLLGPHADEIAMDMALGVTHAQAVVIARIAGVAEIAIGLAILLLPRREWPLWLTLAAMIGLGGYAALAVPRLLIGAFNPVTINVAMAALALVALLLMRDQRSRDPSATESGSP